MQKVQPEIQVTPIKIGSSALLRSQSIAALLIKIVLPNEIDPAKGRISFYSPLGKALLGRRAGDKVSYNVGDRILEMEIIEVDPEQS